MKYMLMILVCSFIQGNACMRPVEVPKLYNSWYECSIEAHKESTKILQKMGYATVNQYHIGAKYTCKLMETS